MSEDASSFSADERAAIYRVIAERRDMRHFTPEPVDPAILKRLLWAAHHAPSVGYMQPWRFIRITDVALRKAMHALVEAERTATAHALGEREAEFMRLKVEGVLDSAELWVAALMDGRERHVFGRRTLPEMDLASVACAIQNMWLAARAEGIGLGWVSIFDPEKLAGLLAMPAGARPVAILCIGHVVEFYPRPMLESEGWGERLPMDRILFENRWPADAESTPAAY
ncbi:MAG: 5,6-dimethylbenzimidazole synthase [Betaproteobacteria bacterium]|nr:5,6-dimethylbenzimidazole synthase [Betaproteobacteria bacterium]